ncbi:MAG TPA: hypothetical protein VFR97_11495 [Capillimicrobium sp.]|nr:hypothetical protein [Capillimicrobium sp.]
MHPLARPAALAAAALLTCAAPAAAATPENGALYGGGAKTATGEFNEYTTIRVAKDGASINFFGEWGVKCEGGGRDLAYITAEDVALGGDGSFSGKGEVSGQGPLGSQTGSFRFSGRFTKAHVATGTARVDIQQTLTAGGGAACTSGTFRWTVVDPSQRAARAVPRRNAMFFGSTAQTYPALLRLDRRGEVAFAALEYELSCTKEAQPLFLDERMPGSFIELQRNGRFAGEETYTSSRVTLQGNGELVVTAKLRGAFRNGRLSGTWSLTGVVKDRTTGAQLDTCTSGKIEFSAAGA